jgi:hypothetical protein
MEIGPVKVSLQPPRGTVAIGTPELGTFRPLTGALRPGTGIVSTGQVIGFLKDPGILIPICSRSAVASWAGRVAGRAALKGQPVAWLRSMKLG